jgi:hypothetical protein
MMQTAPTHVTAYRRTINQEPRRYRGAELAPLTPAERIALTIALLNRGLDLIDEFARMSLAVCTRGAFRGHPDPERERRLRGTTYFRTRPNN